MLENVNPSVYERKRERQFADTDFCDDVVDVMDAREVFDLIRDIKDPEHPLTLEELNVVSEESVSIDVDKNWAQVKLLRCLPIGTKVDVRIAEGTHSTEAAVNKQLADKERVAAALENPQLLRVVNQCILNS